MSEPRKRRVRIRSGYVGLLVAGAVVGALLFAATSLVMQSTELGAVPRANAPIALSRAAWGLPLGAIAVLVGLAGVAQRETPFTKGLFVTVLSGFALAFEIFVFGGWVWADGFIIYALIVILPVLFTISMAFVCTVGRSTFGPRTA